MGKKVIRLMAPMLDDNQSHAEMSRQLRKNDLESVHSTGGHTDNNCLVSL